MSNTAIKNAFISKNDKKIDEQPSPYQDKLDTVDTLFGSISDTISFEESKKERLSSI